jgi:hypothetical protein
MRIGEFEVAARAADPERELDTFLFCGQEFTVAPEVNILAIGRFQMAAGEGVDSNDPDALPLLIQTIASCVVEEDENRFLNLATRRRADPDLPVEDCAGGDRVADGFPYRTAGRLLAWVVNNWGEFQGALILRGAVRAEDLAGHPVREARVAAHPELYEDFGTVADQGRALSAAG